jgi:DivIVA domain-containing protein
MPELMDFKTTVLGGYDREEVDAYIARMRQELEEERERHSPTGAVKAALDQVGGEVSGILQRAHDTAAEVTRTARAEAEELTSSSQREAQERLSSARREADTLITQAKADAVAITARAEARLRELDLDTDRIWAERDRIVADVRDLSRQLVELADVAVDRFPPEESLLEEAGPALDGETLEADALELGVLEPDELEAEGLETEVRPNGNGPHPIGPA